MTYQIGDVLFIGDTFFMPDYNTARCDFPGGSAEVLYESIQRLYALPDDTRVLTCHDYQPGGRALRYESTIGEERATNIQLNARTTREPIGLQPVHAVHLP
jgi:glyoxylase-like metal-dependent hydrolase (beta-lactamase superfamily II)